MLERSESVLMMEVSSINLIKGAVRPLNAVKGIIMQFLVAVLASLLVIVAGSEGSGFPWINLSAIGALLLLVGEYLYTTITLDKPTSEE